MLMDRREFLGVVTASAFAQNQSPDVPTMALLGQALIRHDLRRGVPCKF